MRAIQKLRPDFHLTQVDIVCCSNTMSSLFDFAMGSDRTFRAGVELIGSTLFIVRKTDSSAEEIYPVYGHGHRFADAYSSWDEVVKGSESHPRIVKYDFAGLKFLVRSETDGYLPQYVDATVAPSVESLKSEETISDLDEAVQNLHVTTSDSLEQKSLSVRSAGTLIPQKAILDLKTRSFRKKPKNGIAVGEEFLQRLWYRQTPNLVLAYHEEGVFDAKNVNILDVKEDVTAWEAENTDKLKQFGMWLGKIIEFAKEKPEHARFEIRRRVAVGLSFGPNWRTGKCCLTI